METFITTRSTELTVMTCWCGLIHAVPTNLYDVYIESDHKNLHCPLGHSYVPSKRREKREDKLAAKVAHLREQNEHLREERQQAEKKASTYKGHLTRTKKRISGGVCPCCNRSFENLARHMKSKHPKYGKQ